MPLAGPIQASLRRVGVRVQALQAALSELEERGLGCPTLLKAAKLLRDEYDSLASAAPTTPRPAATTRTVAPTPAKTAPFSTTTTSKSTRNDATTPPSTPVLTLKAVDERIQSAIRPLQADIDTLKASLAAAATTPPTPPTTPPQPLEDDYDSANRSFAKVAAVPPLSSPWPRPSPVPAPPTKPATEPSTPASYLVHLYAPPNLDIQRVRQTLGMPETIPTSRTSKGDVLVRMPTASAAAHLRVAAAAAQLNPATPLWMFGVVAHGLPRVGEAEEMLIEGLEKRVGEGGVRSVRWLPSRKREARFGSMMAVLWNEEMVSRVTKGNRDLWIDPAVCVRCERARGRKEMTHGEEAGQTAARPAGGAQAAQGAQKSSSEGAAGEQKPKQRGTSEEKKTKDEPAGAKLAKSGGAALATSTSLDEKTCNAPITTTSTSSTPANPFEPVLPPELSDFSIERSAHDDFGAVLEENAIPAGAMRQQVSHLQVEYAPPALHAPAKSDGVESRVSEEPSPFAELENAPFSPLLRAPSTELYRTNTTPSTGASAPSTSDMHLVAESPLSPTLAARHQEAPVPSFLESKPTSGIWSHIPSPRPDPPTPTQYQPMPVIHFEPTASEADRSWADETEEAFPLTRAKPEKEERESEGEGGEEGKWKKVEKTKMAETVPKRVPRMTRSGSGGSDAPKTKTASRARRVGAPVPKEKLRAKAKNLICLRKNPKLASTDIVLLQEPPRPLKPFNDPNWRLLTPPPTLLPDGEPAPTRNLILVSTRLGPAAATQVAVESGDVVAVDVELSNGETIQVISMYNPCNERGKEVRYLPYNTSISTILPPLLAATPASYLVVLAGNFNLSHPDWDELVGEPDEAAEEAVRTFIHHNLTHYLPPNTITHHPHNPEHRKKPLDLVLGSLRAEERVVSCGLADDLESGSDHQPIRLVLALETTTYTPPPRRAFCRTDPAILERAFLDAIFRLPTSPLLMPVDIDEQAVQLTDALQTAVSAAKLYVRARTGRIVPWWDDELAEASSAARRAANRAFRLRGVEGRKEEGEAAWSEKKRRRNEMKEMMRRKKESWEEKELAAVTEATLWTTVNG